MFGPQTSYPGNCRHSDDEYHRTTYYSDHIQQDILPSGIQFKLPISRKSHFNDKNASSKLATAGPYTTKITRIPPQCTGRWCMQIWWNPDSVYTCWSQCTHILQSCPPFGKLVARALVSSICEPVGHLMVWPSSAETNGRYLFHMCSEDVHSYLSIASGVLILW
jgi:hypothetical protein